MRYAEYQRVISAKKYQCGVYVQECPRRVSRLLNTEG